MLVGNGSNKKTRIRSGDKAVFYIGRNTIAFYRKRTAPGGERLRWSNGDDQMMLGRRINAFEADCIINVICETHNLSFELVEDRSEVTMGEPTVTYSIVPPKS